MRVFLFFLLLVLALSPAYAARESFESWLAHFAYEARQQGVSPETIQKALMHVEFDPDVIELDRKQPETRLTFEQYARGIVSEARVEKGQRLLRDHRRTLDKLTAQYGVPQSMIVALWGIESSFGVSPGEYRILDSLATLAYEGRRAAFFKKELIEALKIVDEEKMDPDQMEGSWAGAMGQCQFMPSTHRAYAADFDGDGKRDIWDNDEDALASIANYLKAEGWQPGWRWGREVRLTRKIPASQMGLEVKHTLAFWQKKGVKLLSGQPLLDEKTDASLIQPDGAGGRAFLVYDNFRALMRWNRSTYFATSVGLLADEIDSGT